MLLLALLPFTLAALASLQVLRVQTLTQEENGHTRALLGFGSLALVALALVFLLLAALLLFRR